MDIFCLSVIGRRPGRARSVYGMKAVRQGKTRSDVGPEVTEGENLLRLLVSIIQQYIKRFQYEHGHTLYFF